jgi:hypothetical protein
MIRPRQQIELRHARQRLLQEFILHNQGAAIEDGLHSAGIQTAVFVRLDRFDAESWR